MNRDEFEGRWHQLKGKIQEKWGKFTDEDLAKINGKYEQLIGKFERVYGYTKEKAEREFKTWIDGDHVKKEPPRLWSEETPNLELAHEDLDPIYPLEPIKDEQSKDQAFWKKERKAKPKDDTPRPKKRKAS